eukprot:753129-Hanusia_phi.AAC.1
MPGIKPSSSPSHSKSGSVGGVMAREASRVGAAPLLLLTSLCLLLVVFVLDYPASSVSLQGKSEGDGGKVQGWGSRSHHKQGFQKGWPEYDRVDDPPSGWVNVGTRSVHVSRSGSGDLEKIDVPGDAVIRPVSDGYEVSLPDERERDLYDEDRHIKKSRKWLKRSQFSDREWDENRLLRKFWNSEVHPDTRWRGWSKVGNLIDHVSDGDTAMHVHLQRQKEGPGFPSDTGTTRNVWYYHDGSYSYDNPSKATTATDDVDESPEDVAQDCDLKCIISHIAETIASAIVSNNSSKKAVSGHALPKWFARGDKSRTGIRVITSKDGSVEQMIVPYDSVLSRGPGGWKITFPKLEKPVERPNSGSKGSVGLPVNQKWLHPAHSIVDVYSPYSDPYYCVDGSSNPECGTDRWVRERTHDYSLGWDGPLKEKRAKDWEAYNKREDVHDLEAEALDPKRSDIADQTEKEEDIAKALVHLLAGLKLGKTPELMETSRRRWARYVEPGRTNDDKQYWAGKRDERMWQKLSKVWDPSERNRQVEHRLAQLWQRSQTAKPAQRSEGGRFQQLALSSDLHSLDAKKTLERRLEKGIDSRALEQLREQQERRQVAVAVRQQASESPKKGATLVGRSTVRDQVRSWLSSYGDTGASLLLNRGERLAQYSSKPQL